MIKLYLKFLIAVSALSLVLLALFTQVALACTGNEKLIFSCTTTKQMYVEVCDARKTISYAFGKKGAKPEMALSVPRVLATTHQWNGMGRYITYAVNIPNGKTIYSVFTSFDKSDDLSVDAGVNVETNGKRVATVKCKPETVQHNIEGIDLRAAE